MKIFHHVHCTTLWLGYGALTVAFNDYKTIRNPVPIIHFTMKKKKFYGMGKSIAFVFPSTLQLPVPAILYEIHQILCAQVSYTLQIGQRFARVAQVLQATL